jgi:cytidylate kinase
MIRTVTLAREYGSGGGQIAECVARRLGWELIDRNLLEEISEKFHLNVGVAQRLQERGSWWLERVARAIWLHTGGTTVDVADVENVHEFTRHAILEAARRGNCVIVGRGGQCVLQERSDVLHVFVFAPLEYRVERLRRRYKGEDGALNAIERVDDERAAYIREFYDTEWKNPSLYQLWVNGTMGVESAAEMIVNGVKDQKP